MLNHPTFTKLEQLRLSGMAAGFRQQLEMSEVDQLSFEERIGLLIDMEITERENRRLQNRLKKAKLRQSASFEDIDFKQPRGLDRAMILQLGSCQWVRSHDNVLITGPTGVGKIYLACALAHKACLEGYTVHYLRISRLFQELSLAKGDGRFHKFLGTLAKTDLLLLDDWGLAPFSAEQCRDLLEVLDDRHGNRSTMITSQFPVEHWHKTIGDPTFGDAILDRLVHNAYKITLKGESMRKLKTKKGEL